MSLGTKWGHPHLQIPQDLAHAMAAAVASDHGPPMTALGVEPVPGELSVTHPGGVGVLPGVTTRAVPAPFLHVAEPQIVGSHVGGPGLVVPGWRPDWPHP